MLTQREEAYGRRTVKRVALALLVLAAALILAGLGVPEVKAVAVVALIAMVALALVAPWLGPRRRA